MESTNLGITFFCVLGGISYAADLVTCRGNYFLDIENSATKKDLLYCFIDSDAVNGFELRFNFNGAQMENSTASTLKSYSALYVQG